MEHYVICIWNGSLSEKDHHLINYLKTLFPHASQYQSIEYFAQEIAVLLKPVSKHIAILNTCKENEVIEWLDFNIEDIISNGCIKDDSKSEFLTKDTIDHISTSLHSLADQLPAFGTYKLDILLDYDVLRNLSVRKESVLAGTFIRLTRWHSAHFAVFKETEHDSEELNEWCEIINAHILHKQSKVNLGPSLWRGAISANTAGSACYEGFELKLDTEEECHVFHFSKNNTEEEISSHIVVSSQLQIISEVSFLSVPSYFISPVKFRLHLGRPNVINEKSFRLIDYFLSNKEAAVILRLEYAEINAKTKPERKYSTSRWQKAISSDNLRSPQCFVSSFDKFITLAATKAKNSDHIIAYPLQKLSLEPNFYFTLINQRVACHIPEEKCLEANGTFSEIPLVNGDLFQKILSVHMNQKVHYLKKGSLSSSTESNSDFSFLMGNLKNFITSPSLGTVNSTSFLLEEIDPTDWPERMHLLQKQMQNETEEYVPRNIGQSLKLPHQSFSLSIDFIAQYFLPSGEPKNLANVESIYQLNSDHNITYDFNRVLQSKWPEIINCVYHDVYYNSSLQSEDKENLGSQMVKLYVQHETASTCSSQQVTQNFSVNLSEKSLTPRKEFRSPSRRAANSPSRKRYENNISPKENFLKHLISSKALSSTLYGGNPSNTNNCNINSVNSIKSKRNLNKNLVPVRCSPRKKKTVNYKYPVVNRNVNNSKDSRSVTLNKGSTDVKNTKDSKNIKSGKNHASNAMSDLLRRKIRHAVATALENNGINMTHAFFKPCGSKLFSICKTFLDDLTLKKGKTSEYLQKIADAHVKQVIEFYQS